MKTGSGKSNVSLAIWVIAGLALALCLPAWAQKKKAPPAAPQKLSDQRTVAYFDVSKIVWPNPPAITRIRFVDLFTGQKIDPEMFSKKKEKPKQKWMDRLAGATQTDEIKVTDLPFQLIRPYGVAVDSKGLIYASDQRVDAIFIFDAEHKDHVELIGNGKQAHFGELSGLATDDNDRLFAVDTGLRRVDVFKPGTHELEASFGADVLVRPSGIAIDTENRFVYVVDTQSDVVDVFDADTFKLLRKIGTPGKKHTLTSPGNFSLPVGVAVDHDGNVYVTDTFNNRVEVFDPDGGFISTFGKNGDGPADFERPKGIAVDGDGHIWVADSAQDRVKVFNQEGQLLIYFGEHGEYPGRFMGIYGLAISKDNRVVTTEMFPGRVQMFRYITDAEAEAEKQRRETSGNTAAVTAKPASQPAQSDAAKDSAVKQ
ncbi:MAG TPA: SMP-30/gluconolactonase/LRE family protein [Candidatus Sulfotelmatobacter sp.]|nr:SMP-30/gluconolactonase/LRE family protein [Candidatus Sulfotelmatobacter sp.]